MELGARVRSKGLSTSLKWALEHNELEVCIRTESSLKMNLGLLSKFRNYRKQHIQHLFAVLMEEITRVSFHHQNFTQPMELLLISQQSNVARLNFITKTLHSVQMLLINKTTLLEGYNRE